MKAIPALLILLFLTGCSEKQIEEFAFRKTLEYELTDLCGDDKDCLAAIKDQTKACMEKSDWRKYLKDPDNKEELKRFTTEFYACIVDPNGKPYFVANP